MYTGTNFVRRGILMAIFVSLLIGLSISVVNAQDSDIQDKLSQAFTKAKEFFSKGVDEASDFLDMTFGKCENDEAHLPSTNAEFVVWIIVRNENGRGVCLIPISGTDAERIWETATEFVAISAANDLALGIDFEGKKLIFVSYENESETSFQIPGTHPVFCGRDLLFKDEDGNLVLLRYGETEVEILGELPIGAASFTCTPDHSVILFDTDNNVWRWNENGSELIVENATYPSLTADGNAFLYTGSTDGRFGIYGYDFTSGQHVFIGDGIEAEVLPDGSGMRFVSMSRELLKADLTLQNGKPIKTNERSVFGE